VAAYEAALTERTRERVPLQWATTQNDLGTALARLGERESGTSSFEAAAKALRNAQAVYTRESDPSRWVRLQNSIGYTFVLIAERTTDATYVEEAVSILRAGLEEQTKLKEPQASITAARLCRALLGLGRMKKDRHLLLEAKGLCLGAIEGEKALEANWAVEETMANLANIEKALAELK
jgi:tetratricopeptide (TPR) repeat protein